MTAGNVSPRLANLLAVTDAGLTGMDIDELLSEVLERGRLRRRYNSCGRQQRDGQSRRWRVVDYRRDPIRTAGHLSDRQLREDAIHLRVRHAL